jgi:hypothetical protein
MKNLLQRTALPLSRVVEAQPPCRGRIREFLLPLIAERQAIGELNAPICHSNQLILKTADLAISTFPVNSRLKGSVIHK